MTVVARTPVPTGEPGVARTASHRDRAILTAVAAGRCAVVGAALLIDGCGCTDQFAAARLQAAGWLRLAGAPGTPALAEITPAGRAQLPGAHAAA